MSISQKEAKKMGIISQKIAKAAKKMGKSPQEPAEASERFSECIERGELPRAPFGRRDLTPLATRQ